MKQYCLDYEHLNDTEFSAYARFLQSKWRKENEINIGQFKNRKGELITLGNFIDQRDAKSGANFLTDNIREVVHAALQNREKGAVIQKDRLLRNMLSSQPMAFNLFGELTVDLDLATKVFRKLISSDIKKVTKIIFEHSDGRGDPEYSSDSSAFDVFAEFDYGQNKKGFIGIEVKYAESLKDSPSDHRQRYEELSAGIINLEGNLTKLKGKPIQQIWRDHLLAIAHLKHKSRRYGKGFFIYLYPKQNKECDEGVKKYVDCLVSESEEESGFYPRFLEEFVEALLGLDDAEWIKEFARRYLGRD